MEGIQKISDKKRNMKIKIGVSLSSPKTNQNYNDVFTITLSYKKLTFTTLN